MEANQLDEPSAQSPTQLARQFPGSQATASSGLDQQRSEDKADGTPTLEVKSTRTFFAWEDVRGVPCAEAHGNKVDRQLNVRRGDAAVRFRRELTDTAGVTGYRTIARRAERRQFIASARFVLVAGTGTHDRLLDTQCPRTVIAHAEERAQQHTECDYRDEGELKHQTAEKTL